MARKSLFAPGPFLMGLTMVGIGALAFAALLVIPAGQSAETMKRIGEMAGMFGGALIGVGLVAMMVGYLRWNRQE